MVSRPVGAAVAGLAALALHAAPAVTAVPRVRSRIAPRLAGFGRSGQVALTFDDGPNPASTGRFLSELARRDVRATFFVLGESLHRAPSLGAEIAAAGHEIAVHGWTHRTLLLSGPAAVYSQLARSADLIEAVTGERPRHYRPPHGILTSSTLWALNRLDLVPRLWNCSGREWRRYADVTAVCETLQAGLGPGATILLHDTDAACPAGTWRRALAVLPYLLDECAERGLRVGPLREHG